MTTIKFYNTDGTLRHEIFLDNHICPNCGRWFFKSDCEVQNMGQPGYCLCGRDLKKYPIVTDEEWLEFFNKLILQG